MCDCLGALTRAIIYENRPTIGHPNFDILWSIFDLKDEIPIRLKYEHVYGHQDTAGLNREITRLELLNCETDRGTKEFLQYVQSQGMQAELKLYGSQWCLRHGQDYIIYNNVRDRIYAARHGEKLQRHIIKKGILGRIIQLHW